MSGLVFFFKKYGSTVYNGKNTENLGVSERNIS
jgi:hypothetical protein